MKLGADFRRLCPDPALSQVTARFAEAVRALPTQITFTQLTCCAWTGCGRTRIAFMPFRTRS